MKRTSLLSILAALCAALLPLAASGQIAKERPARPVQTDEARWEIFAGYGYTSLNQVNQSRYGLQGVNVSVTRDFGRYFGITADGGFYSSAVGNGNPGNPSVDTILAGPVLHGRLYGPLTIFVHVLLGGEHTGGESMKPDISFAGGAGLGMDYDLRKHIAVRLSGDSIASSFVSDPNHQGLSTHKRNNARAALGIVYRF
ncbi:MAG: outer membrane beta-barrel protein [Terracidiphilus sp.]